MNHLDGCNMTVHRDYANKSCPGDYLYNRHGEIAAEVNRRLGAAVDTPTEDKPTTSSVKAGDTVKISSTATYYGGKAIPVWVKAKNWIVREVSGDRAIIDKSVDGKNAICSPINTKFLSVVSAASTPSQSAWTPQVGDYVSFTGKRTTQAPTVIERCPARVVRRKSHKSMQRASTLIILSMPMVSLRSTVGLTAILSPKCKGG